MNLAMIWGEGPTQEFICFSSMAFHHKFRNSYLINYISYGRQILVSNVTSRVNFLLLFLLLDYTLSLRHIILTCMNHHSSGYKNDKGKKYMFIYLIYAPNSCNDVYLHQKELSLLKFRNICINSWAFVLHM